MNLKLQGIIDEKDETLFQIRYEGRSKSKFLKKTIQDLRRQFSGALTLGKQEKFSASLRSYQEKKLELEKALQEVFCMTFYDLLKVFQLTLQVCKIHYLQLYIYFVFSFPHLWETLKTCKYRVINT